MSGELQKPAVPINPDLREWMTAPQTQLAILRDGDAVAVFANETLRNQCANFLAGVRRRQELARRKAFE